MRKINAEQGSKSLEFRRSDRPGGKFFASRTAKRRKHRGNGYGSFGGDCARRQSCIDQSGDDPQARKADERQRSLQLSRFAHRQLHLECEFHRLSDLRAVEYYSDFGTDCNHRRKARGGSDNSSRAGDLCRPIDGCVEL